MAKKPPAELGARLRQARTERKLSLRDIERESGMNTGYLSQLERGEVANPRPSVLQRVAVAYGEPFNVVMQWAGYVEPDPAGVSMNAQRALSVLGDDFSDEELAAMKAVLDVLRTRQTARFSAPHRSDLILPSQDMSEIRQHALGVLRELDVARTPEPVDLDQALLVAKLVRAGAIELTLEEKKGLRARFHGMVDWALKQFQGIVHLDRGEVYVNEDLYEQKRRFVEAHEIGHAVLPEHKLIYAHLDDEQRLKRDFNDLLERQANQFSIELLGKGDLLREQFDSSKPSLNSMETLGLRYSISLQAAARQLAEQSRQECAVAIAWRSQRGRGPLQSQFMKVWCSTPFEKRFHWEAGLCPKQGLRTRLESVGQSDQPAPLISHDKRGPVELVVEGVDRHYAVLLLMRPVPVPLRNRLRPGGSQLLRPSSVSS